MTAFPKTKMTEATLLTREGRLAEAMAVLRRALPCRRLKRPTAESATVVVDMVAPTDPGGTWTPKQFGEPRSPEPAVGARRAMVPKVLQGFLDQIQYHNAAIGLDALVRPPAARRRVALPEGARFEKRAFANAAGSRDYKLYVPSSYADRKSVV